ncbi:MAG TPA: phosphatase PAP2 family protein [Burkholderiales bacterium]|nr:phosphatase PAP2 family protein [Burkholderiales bacterium]
MRRFDTTLRTVAVWDEAWCLRFNHAAGIPWICALFRAVSRLGDGIFWYALMAGLLALGGKAAVPAVAHMAVVGALGVLLYKWLKSQTLRPRPYQVKAAILRGADPLDNFSFPSGHTLHAVSFSMLAIAHFPPTAYLVLPFAALVAASRLVLGLHYPTDVLAGAALGATLALASLAIV